MFAFTALISIASELPYLFLIFLENEDSYAITLYFFVRNHLFSILLPLLQLYNYKVVPVHRNNCRDARKASVHTSTLSSDAVYLAFMIEEVINVSLLHLLQGNWSPWTRRGTLLGFHAATKPLYPRSTFDREKNRFLDFPPSACRPVIREH